MNANDLFIYFSFNIQHTLSNVKKTKQFPCKCHSGEHFESWNDGTFHTVIILIFSLTKHFDAFMSYNLSRFSSYSLRSSFLSLPYPCPAVRCAVAPSHIRFLFYFTSNTMSSLGNIFDGSYFSGCSHLSTNKQRCTFFLGEWILI